MITLTNPTTHSYWSNRMALVVESGSEQSMEGLPCDLQISDHVPVAQESGVDDLQEDHRTQNG